MKPKFITAQRQIKFLGNYIKKRGGSTEKKKTAEEKFEAAHKKFKKYEAAFRAASEKFKKYNAAFRAADAARAGYAALAQFEALLKKSSAQLKKSGAAMKEQGAVVKELGAIYLAAFDKARADIASAIAAAKAKARQGKKRARHCRATLKPVDDHLEIVEIVECVQTMEAIADMCGTATNQFQVDKYLNASIDNEMQTLKEYATQCVTENIMGFSALMVYEVTQETKDQYAGLIEKCRQEETNTLGVLGYEFIWPCFKDYLDMIDEPLEPAPVEDSETLPKVKA